MQLQRRGGELYDLHILQGLPTPARVQEKERPSSADEFSYQLSAQHGACTLTASNPKPQKKGEELREP